MDVASLNSRSGSSSFSGHRPAAGLPTPLSARGAVGSRTREFGDLKKTIIAHGSLVPSYDIYGREFKKDKGYVLESVEPREEWLREPKYATRSDMLRARRAQRCPDVSSDSNSNSIVGSKDNGRSAVHHLFSEAAGEGHSNTTLSELKQRRKADLARASTDLRDAWDQNHPIFAAEPPVCQEGYVAEPLLTRIGTRQEKYKKEAKDRMWPELMDMIATTNSEERDDGNHSRTRPEPPATRSEMLRIRQIRHAQELAKAEEQRAPTYLSARERTKRREDEAFDWREPRTEPTTRSQLMTQRREDLIQQNARFEPRLPEVPKFTAKDVEWWTYQEDYVHEPGTSCALREIYHPIARAEPTRKIGEGVALAATENTPTTVSAMMRTAARRDLGKQIYEFPRQALPSSARPRSLTNAARAEQLITDYSMFFQKPVSYSVRHVQLRSERQAPTLNADVAPMHTYSSFESIKNSETVEEKARQRRAAAEDEMYARAWKEIVHGTKKGGGEKYGGVSVFSTDASSMGVGVGGVDRLASTATPSDPSPSVVADATLQCSSQAASPSVDGCGGAFTPANLMQRMAIAIAQPPEGGSRRQSNVLGNVVVRRPSKILTTITPRLPDASMSERLDRLNKLGAARPIAAGELESSSHSPRRRSTLDFEADRLRLRSTDSRLSSISTQGCGGASSVPFSAPTVAALEAAPPRIAVRTGGFQMVQQELGFYGPSSVSGSSSHNLVRASSNPNLQLELEHGSNQSSAPTFEHSASGVSLAAAS